MRQPSLKRSFTNTSKVKDQSKHSDSIEESKSKSGSPSPAFKKLSAIVSTTQIQASLIQERRRRERGESMKNCLQYELINQELNQFDAATPTNYPRETLMGGKVEEVAEESSRSTDLHSQQRAAQSVSNTTGDQADANSFLARLLENQQQQENSIVTKKSRPVLKIKTLGDFIAKFEDQSVKQHRVPLRQSAILKNKKVVPTKIVSAMTSSIDSMYPKSRVLKLP